MIKTQESNCMKIFDNNNKNKDQNMIKDLEQSFAGFCNDVQYILRKIKKSSKIRQNR